MHDKEGMLRCLRAYQAIFILIALAKVDGDAISHTTVHLQLRISSQITNSTIPPNNSTTTEIGLDGEPVQCAAVNRYGWKFNASRAGRLSSSILPCNDSEQGLRPQAAMYCSRNGTWHNIVNLTCDSNALELLNQTMVKSAPEERAALLYILSKGETFSASYVNSVVNALVDLENNTLEPFTDSIADHILAVADSVMHHESYMNFYSSLKVRDIVESVVRKVNIPDNDIYSTLLPTFSAIAYEIAQNNASPVLIRVPQNNKDIFSRFPTKIAITIPSTSSIDKLMLVTTNSHTHSPNNRKMLGPVVSINTLNQNRSRNQEGLGKVSANITFYLSPSEKNKSITCAIYNKTTQEWRTEEWLTTDNDNGAVLCSSNHIGDFSVLANESLLPWKVTTTAESIHEKGTMPRTSSAATTRAMMLCAQVTENNLTFASTGTGLVSSSSELCSGAHHRPLAARLCMRSLKWGKIMLSDCGVSNAKVLSQIKETTSEEDIASSLFSVSQNGNLSGSDVNMTTSILRNMSRRNTEISSTTTDLFLLTARNLLSQSKKVGGSKTLTEIRESTSSILLRQNVSAAGEPYLAVGGVLSAKVIPIPQNLSSGIQFGDDVTDQELSKDANLRVSLHVPGSALANRSKTFSKLVVQIFENSTYFSQNEDIKIEGPVISVIIGDSSGPYAISGLSDPINIEFTLKTTEENREFACAYYNNSFQKWELNKEITSILDDKVTCHWTHLTEFGLAETTTSNEATTIPQDTTVFEPLIRNTPTAEYGTENTDATLGGFASMETVTSPVISTTSMEEGSTVTATTSESHEYESSTGDMSFTTTPPDLSTYTDSMTEKQATSQEMLATDTSTILEISSSADSTKLMELTYDFSGGEETTSNLDDIGTGIVTWPTSSSEQTLQTTDLTDSHSKFTLESGKLTTTPLPISAGNVLITDGSLVTNERELSASSHIPNGSFSTNAIHEISTPSYSLMPTTTNTDSRTSNSIKHGILHTSSHATTDDNDASHSTSSVTSQRMLLETKFTDHSVKIIPDQTSAYTENSSSSTTASRTGGMKNVQEMTTGESSIAATAGLISSISPLSESSVIVIQPITNTNLSEMVSESVSAASNTLRISTDTDTAGNLNTIPEFSAGTERKTLPIASTPESLSSRPFESSHTTGLTITESITDASEVSVSLSSTHTHIATRVSSPDDENVSDDKTIVTASLTSSFTNSNAIGTELASTSAVESLTSKVTSPGSSSAATWAGSSESASLSKRPVSRISESTTELGVEYMSTLVIGNTSATVLTSESVMKTSQSTAVSQTFEDITTSTLSAQPVTSIPVIRLSSDSFMESTSSQDAQSAKISIPSTASATSSPASPLSESTPSEISSQSKSFPSYTSQVSTDIRSTDRLHTLPDLSAGTEQDPLTLHPTSTVFGTDGSTTYRRIDINTASTMTDIVDHMTTTSLKDISSGPGTLSAFETTPMKSFSDNAVEQSHAFTRTNAAKTLDATKFVTDGPVASSNPTTSEADIFEATIAPETYCDGDVIANSSFEKTKTGHYARSKENCSSTDDRPRATRYCNRSTMWEEPKELNCSLETVDLLNTASNVSLGESAAILLAVSGFSDLSPSLVDKSANKLSQIVEDATKIDTEEADSLLSTIQNLLGKITENSTSTNVDAGSTILNAATRILQKFHSSGSESFESKMELFSAKATPVPVNGSSLTFGDSAQDKKLLPPSASNLTLTLPREVFQSEGISADMKVAIVVFADAEDLFPSSQGSSAISPIISISIGDSTSEAKVSNLTSPININFDYQDSVYKEGRCVYYDEVNKEWSTEGGTMIDSGGDDWICEWTHLTVLAISDVPETTVEPGTTTELMSSYPSESPHVTDLSTPDREITESISYASEMSVSLTSTVTDISTSTMITSTFDETVSEVTKSTEMDRLISTPGTESLPSSSTEDYSTGSEFLSTKTVENPTSIIPSPGSSSATTFGGPSELTSYSSKLISSTNVSTTEFVTGFMSTLDMGNASARVEDQSASVLPTSADSSTTAASFPSSSVSESSVTVSQPSPSTTVSELVSQSISIPSYTSQISTDISSFKTETVPTTVGSVAFATGSSMNSMSTIQHQSESMLSASTSSLTSSASELSSMVRQSPTSTTMSETVSSQQYSTQITTDSVLSKAQTIDGTNWQTKTSVQSSIPTISSATSSSYSSMLTQSTMAAYSNQPTLADSSMSASTASTDEDATALITSSTIDETSRRSDITIHMTADLQTSAEAFTVSALPSESSPKLASEPMTDNPSLVVGITERDSTSRLLSTGASTAPTETTKSDTNILTHSSTEYSTQLISTGSSETTLPSTSTVDHTSISQSPASFISTKDATEATSLMSTLQAVNNTIDTTTGAETTDQTYTSTLTTLLVESSTKSITEPVSDNSANYDRTSTATTAGATDDTLTEMPATNQVTLTTNVTNPAKLATTDSSLRQLTVVSQTSPESTVSETSEIPRTEPVTDSSSMTIPISATDGSTLFTQTSADEFSSTLSTEIPKSSVNVQSEPVTTITVSTPSSESMSTKSFPTSSSSETNSGSDYSSGSTETTAEVTYTVSTPTAILSTQTVIDFSTKAMMTDHESTLSSSPMPSASQSVPLTVSTEDAKRTSEATSISTASFLSDNSTEKVTDALQTSHGASASTISSVESSTKSMVTESSSSAPQTVPDTGSSTAIASSKSDDTSQATKSPTEVYSTMGSTGITILSTASMDEPTTESSIRPATELTPETGNPQITPKVSSTVGIEITNGTVPSTSTPQQSQQSSAQRLSTSSTANNISPSITSESPITLSNTEASITESTSQSNTSSVSDSSTQQTSPQFLSTMQDTSIYPDSHTNQSLVSNTQSTVTTDMHSQYASTEADISTGSPPSTVQLLSTTPLLASTSATSEPDLNTTSPSSMTSITVMKSSMSVPVPSVTSVATNQTSFLETTVNSQFQSTVTIMTGTDPNETRSSTLPSTNSSVSTQSSVPTTMTTESLISTSTTETPSNVNCSRSEEEGFAFPLTGGRELAFSEEQCSGAGSSNPPSPQAIRYCDRFGNWGNILTQNCSLTVVETLSSLQNVSSDTRDDTLLRLNLLANQTLSESEAATFSDILAAVANLSGQVQTSTTDVFIDNVEKATNMFEGFSDSGLKSDNLRNLGKSLEKFVLKQDISSGSYIISKDEFNVEIIPLPNNVNGGLNHNTSSLQIQIPKQALDIQGQGSDSKISIITFKDNKLFPSSRNPVSQIISLSIGDSNGAADIENLSGDGIQIDVNLKNYSQALRQQYNQETKSIDLNEECVFYDYLTNSWSSNGGTSQSSSDYVNCRWTHATSFSVLASPIFVTQQPQTIVHVGDAMAMTMFFVVFIVYVTFWRLRKDPIDVVTLNIALTLFAAFFAHFCSGLLWGNLPRTGCLALSTLHHFFLLCAFVWMGVMTFLAERCIFEPKKWVLWIALADEHVTAKLIWKLCLAAYGIAVLIWATSTSVWIALYERYTTEIDGVTRVSSYAYTEETYCVVKDWALASGLAIPCALVLLFSVVVQAKILHIQYCRNRKLETSFRGYYTQYHIAIELAERSIIVPLLMSILWAVQFVRVSFDDFTSETYTALDNAYGALCLIFSACLALLLTLRPRHLREISRKVAVRGFSLSEGSYYLDHEGPAFRVSPAPVPDPVPMITLPFGTTVTLAGVRKPSYPRIGIRENVPGVGVRVKRWRASDSVAQTDYELTGGKLGLKGYKQRSDNTQKMSTFGYDGGNEFEEIKLDDSEANRRSEVVTGNDVYATVDKSRSKAETTFSTFASQGKKKSTRRQTPKESTVVDSRVPGSSAHAEVLEPVYSQVDKSKKVKATAGEKQAALTEIRKDIAKVSPTKSSDAESEQFSDLSLSIDSDVTLDNFNADASSPDSDWDKKYLE